MLHFRKIIRSRRFTLFWGLSVVSLEGWKDDSGEHSQKGGITSEIWDIQWTVTVRCQLILMQFRNWAVFTSFCCRCLPPSRTRKHQGQKPQYYSGHPISHSSAWALWISQTELMLQIPCWPFSPWTIEITKSQVMKESHIHLYSSLSLDATHPRPKIMNFTMWKHHMKTPEINDAPPNTSSYH